MKQISCYKCHHEWSYQPPLERRAECPKCHWDAHVCLNCTLYDKNAHHECRESQSEWVQDKESSNFCEYFSPKNAHSKNSESESAKAQLDALFSNSPKDTTDEPQKDGSLEDQLQNFLKNR